MRANYSSVYMQDWLAVHPYTRVISTDKYYIDLANQVLKIWNKTDFAFTVSNQIKGSVACCLTAYFEDIISQSGLWKAFIHKNKELYGKHLPFYSLSENYFEDEVNLEDITFLLWIYMQLYVGSFTSEIIDPEDPSIINMAKEIYDLFDAEYETAPENSFMADYFSFEGKGYDKFPAFSDNAGSLFFKSYLVAPFNEIPLNKVIDQVRKSYPKRSEQEKNAIISETISQMVHNDPCGPLALKINEWFSVIAGTQQPYKKYFDEFEFIDSQEFYVIEKSYSHIKIRSVANGREIDVTKESIKNVTGLHPWKTVIKVCCAFYNDTWWFFGEYLTRNLNDEEDIRPAVDYVKEEKTNDPVYNTFMKASNNEPLMFIPSYDALKEFFISGLSWEDNEDNMMPDLKDEKNFVLYANSKGMLIAPNIAEYVKDDRNPMYNAEEAAKNALDLFTIQGGCPIDLLRFLEESNRLPDAAIKSKKGKEHGKKLLHENWDFIARLFLQSYYRAD